MTRQVVCVVGSGTAGLEGLLAAREQLGSDAELRLVAPEREFRYRPASQDSLFRPAGERALAIADLVAESGAQWTADRAEAIHVEERAVMTRDGDTVNFDFLLLAFGSQAKRALEQGYVWQRGADPSFLDRIIRETIMGEVTTVAVNIPRGARWPLPGYELALVLGWRAVGTDARVTLLTAEERPLAALGSEATAAISRELDAAGVEVIAGVEAIDSESAAGDRADPVQLTLVAEERTGGGDALIGKPTDAARGRTAGTPVTFDRLISLPTVVAPFIAGVPTDAAGFIEVDETLRVCGSEWVWAAGGCIAAALEHSALAAQQADAAIDAIAAIATGNAGNATASAVPPDGERLSAPGAPELTGMLLIGQRAKWLAENPPGIQQVSTRCLWWPPGRAVGRMLAHRIVAWDPAVHQGLPSVAEGVLIRAPIALGCSGSSSLRPDTGATPDVRTARLRDIENRQLMAVERREREANAELRALSAGLQTLSSRQKEVIRELQRHGYLHDRK